MAKKRTGIQLCYPFEERRLRDPKFGWSFPVIVQPKLDGERMRAICRENFPPILLSSTESRIISVPHIEEELKNLNFFGELDGELYIHGKDFSEISSIVGRSKNLHKNFSSMKYHIFDLINNNPQCQRLIDLKKLSPLQKSLKIVKNYVCFSFDDLMDKYSKIILEGYEGIIVRHFMAYYERKRSRFVMKFKPKKNDIYLISDILEGTGEHKNMVGAFLCQGIDQTLFKVSAGEFNHVERKQIWKNKEVIKGKMLLIEYQNLTSLGIPRFGLAKKILEKHQENIFYQGIL